jgi:hypothetical protein
MAFRFTGCVHAIIMRQLTYADGLSCGIRYNTSGNKTDEVWRMESKCGRQPSPFMTNIVLSHQVTLSIIAPANTWEA